MSSIAIIDDDEIDRYLLKRCFAKLGLKHKVLEATSGVYAMEMFFNLCNEKSHDGENPDKKHCQPDAIFLDINMPMMDGFEFLQKLSETIDINKFVANTKVVIITSSDNPKDMEKAHQFDFVSHYIKKGDLNAETLRPIFDLAKND